MESVGIEPRCFEQRPKGVCPDKRDQRMERPPLTNLAVPTGQRVA